METIEIKVDARLIKMASIYLQELDELKYEGDSSNYGTYNAAIDLFTAIQKATEKK